jgi:hypothetical protein
MMIIIKLAGVLNCGFLRGSSAVGVCGCRLPKFAFLSPELAMGLCESPPQG